MGAGRKIYGDQSPLAIAGLRNPGKAAPALRDLFGTERRVTYATFTKKQLLSGVRTRVKEMQEKAPPKPKVRTALKKIASAARREDSDAQGSRRSQMTAVPDDAHTHNSRYRQLGFKSLSGP